MYVAVAVAVIPIHIAAIHVELKISTVGKCCHLYDTKMA